MQRAVLDTATAARAPIRRDLLLIALIAVLMDLPILLLGHYAGHDLLELLSLYKYLYSGLLYDHALPQWQPLVFYGIRSSMLQVPISPFGYATGLIGYLVGWHDAARLLYLSLTAERLLFALSLYYLSLSLYRTRLATVLVPLLGATTIFWFFVPHFNVSSIAFLPLSLLLLLRFARTGSWRQLWLSGLAIAVSTPFPLFAPVLALCFAAMGLALILQQPSMAIYASRPSAGSIALFLLCAATVAADAGLLATALDGLKLLANERGADATLPLRVFLNYSVDPTIDVPAQAMVLGYVKTPQWTAYFGLLPLAGAAIAPFVDKHPALRALTLAALVLIFLTNAGEGAVALFHVPTMDYFRHLQHLYPTLKVFLILMSGFTLDRMIRSLRDAAAPPRWLTPWTLAFAILGLVAVVDAVAGPIVRDVGTASGGGVTAVHLSFLRVAVYGLAGLMAWLLIGRPDANGWRSLVLQGLLAAAILFDLASYQWQSFRQWAWDRTDDATILSSFKATEPRLPLTREREPQNADQARLLAGFAAHARALTSTNYAIYETLTSFDRCFPVARVHYLAEGPARLVALRGGKLEQKGVGSTIPWEDHALMAVLGCESPKFRLVANAVVASSAAERDRLIREAPALDRTVILGPIKDGKAPATAADRPPVSGQIRLAHYEADEIALDVENPAPYPVWLVYADGYDKGWSATINEQAAPLYQAYGAFKAIAVPPGASRVILRFNAGWWPYALILLRLLPGLLGLAALVALLWKPQLACPMRPSAAHDL